MSATVYLLCGLPGTGKTTFAKKKVAEGNTVRYSTDEWIIKLAGRNSVPEDYFRFAAQVKERIKEATVQDLMNGKSVVLDFGFWKKDERKEYIDWVLAHNATPIICYFEVPLEEMIRRLEKRNQQKDNNSLIITPDMLKEFLDQIENPDSSEAKLEITSP